MIDFAVFAVCGSFTLAMILPTSSSALLDYPTLAFQPEYPAAEMCDGVAKEDLFINPD